nr:PAS domain-containing protein [Halovenus salina]
MSAAIFLKDTDGQYLLMNQACRDLFNVADQDIIGLTDDAILPSDVAENARTDDRRVIENGEIIEIEETIPTAEGTTVRLTRKSPVYNDEGEIEGVCGVSTDITERKRNEQELQHLKDQFELAVEGGNIGIWDWDMSTDEVEFNEQWAEMLGYSRDELAFSFDTWERLVHPDDLASVTDALETHIDGDTDIYDHEIRMQTKEGDWKWIQTIGRVVDRDDEGEATRTAGVHIDISDRKQAEQELERTSEFLRETQEVARIGGWEFNLRSGMMRWSDELYHIHGLPLDADLTPEEGIEFYHPDDRETIREAFDRLTTEGEPYDLELRIVTVDNDVRWIRTRGEPSYDGDEIVAVQGTFQDITERKEREQELKRQNSRLNEFASVVSHDLRNPLNVAQIRATALQQQNSNELQEHLRPLVTALERIESIIEDTLTLARQGNTVGEMSTISVVDLIGKCWAGVETAEATFELDDEFTIVGDRDRLQHVFENLFRNAVEHGGEDVTVRIGRCGENCLYVEDDGPGIPPGDRDTVLEPGHTSATGETGFGLTIVKRIAEAHGWGITITDGRDGGARFEFDTSERLDE